MTDQADKAAENRIAVQNLAIICFHRGWNAHREKMKKASPEWIELRNRCAHEMSDLFESLRSHTAPRELVGIVTDLLSIIDAEIDQSTWRQDSPFAVALNNARAALSAQEPKVCELTWNSEGDFHEGSCGIPLFIGDPGGIDKYCYNCGGVIKVKE